MTCHWFQLVLSEIATHFSAIVCARSEGKDFVIVVAQREKQHMIEQRYNPSVVMLKFTEKSRIGIPEHLVLFRQWSICDGCEPSTSTCWDSDTTSHEVSRERHDGQPAVTPATSRARFGFWFSALHLFVFSHDLLPVKVHPSPALLFLYGQFFTWAVGCLVMQRRSEYQEAERILSCTGLQEHF